MDDSVLCHARAEALRRWGCRNIASALRGLEGEDDVETDDGSFMWKVYGGGRSRRRNAKHRQEGSAKIYRCHCFKWTTRDGPGLPA